MDETRIPWWLIVLLAITFASLAVWQSTRWKMRVRWSAGALTLIYLVLLASVIGVAPRSAAGQPPPVRWSITDLVPVIIGGVCITAAAFLLGRPAARGQLVWFAILSLGNAALCFLLRSRDVGCALLVVAGISLFSLIKKLRVGPTIRLSELSPETASEADNESPLWTWLIGGSGFLLALLLVGTTYFATHAERARLTVSQRHSAIPARSRIRTILPPATDAENSASAIDLALGQRADIVVLLAVLMFVSLASTMSETSHLLSPSMAPDSTGSPDETRNQP